MRIEFWRRFHADVERFRSRGSDCEVAVNQFEVRRWDVRFTKKRSGHPPASITLDIVEHAPSRDHFLVAVTPTLRLEDTETAGERQLLSIYYDAGSDRYTLQADHGPVDESRLSDYFAALAATWLATV